MVSKNISSQRGWGGIGKDGSRVLLGSTVKAWVGGGDVMGLCGDSRDGEGVDRTDGLNRAVRERGS